MGKKWESCLELRSWKVFHVQNFAEWLQVRAGQHCDFCLALIDATLADTFLDILRKLECDRKTLSYLAFADPGKISCKEISSLLEKGFDDFIHADMDLRVLAAKLSAHLRRALPEITTLLDETCSASGKLRLSRASQTVQFKSGDHPPIEVSGLTATEFEILAVLVNREGRIVPRKDLLDYIWGNRRVNPENVDKHIESLRRKLGTVRVKIKTVYRVGYIFYG